MLRLHFSFAKRESRFSDLAFSFQQVQSLAQRAIQRWLYIDLSMPDPDFPNHAHCSESKTQIRLRLLDLLSDGDPLGSIAYELTDFESKKDDILVQLAEMIALTQSRSDLLALVAQESETLQNSAGYYVYRHIFRDGRLYIGKGSAGRAKTFEHRNPYYLRTLNECGPPLVLYVKEQMTEHDAYQLESRLIRSANPANLLAPGLLLNGTDGLEKAPIGDMPIRTVLKIHSEWPPKELPEKYTRRVNIYRRYSEDLGAPREYEYDIPIYSAALTIGCTMNDLVVDDVCDLPKMVGKYWLMTKEQVTAERLKP